MPIKMLLQTCILNNGCFILTTFIGSVSMGLCAISSTESCRRCRAGAVETGLTAFRPCGDGHLIFKVNYFFYL